MIHRFAGRNNVAKKKKGKGKCRLIRFFNPSIFFMQSWDRNRQCEYSWNNANVEIRWSYFPFKFYSWPSFNPEKRIVWPSYGSKQNGDSKLHTDLAARQLGKPVPRSYFRQPFFRRHKRGFAVPFVCFAIVFHVSFRLSVIVNYSAGWGRKKRKDD